MSKLFPGNAKEIEKLSETIENIIDEKKVVNLNEKVNIDFYLGGFGGFDIISELPTSVSITCYSEYFSENFNEFKEDTTIYEFLKSASVDVDKSDNMIHAPNYLTFIGHVKPEGYKYIQYNKGDKNPYENNEIFEEDCTVIGIDPKLLNISKFFNKCLTDNFSWFLDLLPNYEISEDVFNMFSNKSGGHFANGFNKISTQMTYNDLLKLQNNFTKDADIYFIIK